MKATRRELRRRKRELAGHNRAQNTRHQLKHLAAQISGQATLERALGGFTWDQRKAMVAALQPHLSFQAVG